MNQSPLLSDNDSLTPAIAILHCYDLIEDFLDSINISFATFCDEFIGSWIFGYAQALQQAGLRPVLFCISARFKQPSRFIHQPTKTTICVLPPTRIYHLYRLGRSKLLNLYGAKANQSFKEIEDNNRLRRSLLTSLKDLAKSIGTYGCTPLNLLAQELKRENCQAIFCQEYEYARFDSCVLLGKLTGLPVFATFQGGNKTQSWLEVPLRHLAFKACTGVIVASQTERERIQTRYHLPERKIARIFNPLDLSKWQRCDRASARIALKLPLDAKIVIWHGRVELERKGLDILLKAWQQVSQQRPQQKLQLILIGTGSDAQQLDELIKTLKLNNVIWLNEFVNDTNLIRLYLSAADLYTLPSRQEGFPLAPIEAMACRLPVVAADAPGVADILEGGEASGGLIIPRGDVTALSSALGQVLDNDSWRLTLGDKARCRVESCFSFKTIGQQLRYTLLTSNQPSFPSKLNPNSVNN